MTDYGAISDETIMKKYEITGGILEDTDEVLDDFFRNTLKNRGPDRITLESDRSRNDKFSKTKLNLLHTGKLSNIEPFQPEIFLELTERDPRGHVTDPDMRRYTEQVKHRGKNYKNVFTSDADQSIPTEGINERKMIENKRAAQFRGKEYRKIFSTSVDGMHRGYNGVPDSKPIGGKIENTNTVMDLNDINNMANRRDWTTKKSFDTPMGYMTTNDHKFKIAKYGNKGKTPDIYNTKIMKNKNQIERDAKELIEHKGNIITKALQLAMEDIKRNRKTNQDPSLNAQILGKSFDSHSRQTNKKSTDKTDEAKNIIKTHKKAKLVEEINKNYGAQIDNTDIVKNKQQAKNDIITGKINQAEVGNKTSANIEEFVTSQVMTKIINSHKIDNKCNNKNTNIYSHIKPVLYEMMNKTKRDTHIEMNGVQKRNPEDYNFYKYNSKLPEHCNTVSKNMEGYDNKAVIKKSSDQSTQSRNLGKLDHENNNKEIIETDIAYKKSGEKDRKTGKKVKSNMMKYTDNDKDNDEIISDKVQLLYSRK